MGSVKELSKQNRHRKALKVTFIAAFLCAIPTVFLYYVSTNYEGSEHYRNIEPPPFLMKQQDGGFFTNQSLIGKVTLLTYIPSDCSDCKQYLSEITKVYNWSLEALRKLEHFEESDVSLTRVAVSSDEKVWGLLSSWNIIEESEQTREDANALRTICMIAPGPFAVIFDRYGKIKSCINYNDFKLKPLQRLLSKITFNTSMDEYLSERTFFGPKKKYSEDIEQGLTP